MAEKVKLNKVELTRLRRDVRTYQQFLPVLKLKQEQLQAEQLKIRRHDHGGGAHGPRSGFAPARWASPSTGPRSPRSLLGGVGEDGVVFVEAVEAVV